MILTISLPKLLLLLQGSLQGSLSLSTQGSHLQGSHFLLLLRRHLLGSCHRRLQGSGILLLCQGRCHHSLYGHGPQRMLQSLEHLMR